MTEELCKKLYRELSKKVHPDLNPNKKEGLVRMTLLNQYKDNGVALKALGIQWKLIADDGTRFNFTQATVTIRRNPAPDQWTTERWEESAAGRQWNTHREGVNAQAEFLRAQFEAQRAARARAEEAAGRTPTFDGRIKVGDTVRFFFKGVEKVGIVIDGVKEYPKYLKNIFYFRRYIIYCDGQTLEYNVEKSLWHKYPEFIRKADFNQYRNILSTYLLWKRINNA